MEHMDWRMLGNGEGDISARSRWILHEMKILASRVGNYVYFQIFDYVSSHPSF